ncbi:MAG TPA: NADH:ubiquinone reductase (Na(+)-transporting) subunit B [Candidatus Marinimicrobia bacterium]|nr:NADH:ubiquinone reductase (Na(+)-transporting) subunit B [Candidatus Neomarinimicrobiota bacterium]
MNWLLKLLLRVRPNFEEGGKYHQFWAIYEATETILFGTDKRTKTGPHIRDYLDIKRVMILVVISLLPCYVFGMINVGYQSALANGESRLWWENAFTGFKIILPIIIITFISGAFWEILFAVVRKHEISEGFLVTCALIPLIMPPTIPLWQVSVATTIGIVIGKEIFGGVGMNIFNPALVARAFIFFAYPRQISGEKVWVTAFDGFSGATALAVPASTQSEQAVSLLNSVIQFDFSWINMFLGWIPGSIGETSKLMVIIGAVFLIATGISSWRVMLGAVIGLVVTSFLTNLLAPYSTNSMLTIPPHYHLVMGSFAFGISFMATEPVTGAHTDAGRWIYGICIGVLTVIIRTINPAYPEGVMLAILLMNAFASLIDYFVVRSNIRKRVTRYAQ